MCAKTVRHLVALARITYGCGVLNSTHIRAAILSVFLSGFAATVSEARDLTPRERVICSSLRACVDIIRRHDATEFDYNVLKTEFRRFGPAGREALFNILESDDGQADIARLISSLGPLTAAERQRIGKVWSQAKSASYLPLFTDGHAKSRDFLLRTLGHPNADVREKVRTALLRLPHDARLTPLPKTVQTDLITALQRDPISQAAPYLALSDAKGQEADFAELLRSGNADIVTAAYSALYRNNPERGFNSLLSEMSRMDSALQSQAVGQMLASRHKTRPDGFYLNFARDMSGDAKLSVPARASGLHGLMLIAHGPFPDLTPARLEALSFLLKGRPFVAQDRYLPYLESSDADAALEFIWRMAQEEKWVNRDRIAEFYKRGKLADQVTSDLLKADDQRAFTAGLARVKPAQLGLVRAQIDHPIAEISGAARQKLGLTPRQKSGAECPIKPFDIADMRSQMPFFESGWMAANSGRRTSLPRKFLTSAHPTARGWLAGYDLSKPGSRSALTGGAVLHYDNRSGAFELIGDFQGPIAILPARPIQLGETSDYFWIIDHWGQAAPGVSVYKLDMSADKPRTRHMGSLPESAHAFSTASNGDLISLFKDESQSPIQLSQSGQMSSACAASMRANAPRAPQ